MNKTVFLNILEKKALPIYGEGENIRDWLYVQDHCEALLRVFEQGKAGETYNVGGGEELTNIEIVRTLCALLDEKLDRQPGSSEALITQLSGLMYCMDLMMFFRRLG